MNRHRILFLTLSCLALILLERGDCRAAQGKTSAAAPQQKISAPVLTTADHAALNHRIQDVKGSARALERTLDEMANMPAAERAQTWPRVHDAIALLKMQSAKLQENASALRSRDLKREDWAALRRSAGVEMTSVNASLNKSLKAYEALLNLSKSPETSKEDIKAKRSETESKFKDGEQQRNSDYNILISIVKTMNEEMGVFNKSMQ